MAEEFKRLDRKLVYHGTIIDYYRDTIQVPNGNIAEWDFIGHKGAAAVVPVREDGKLLMVRQWRNALDRYTLEIPAGKLDSVNEDPLDCATRELREETGLSAERMTCLTTLLTTPGFCTEKIAVYLAQGLSQGDTHPDEDEFLGLPLEEAFEMVMRGEICDGKTICGLMMAREIVARQKA